MMVVDKIDVPRKVQLSDYDVEVKSNWKLSLDIVKPK